MRKSMWTYPWDVLDLGTGEVSDELRDIGFDTISVATSYHAGRFLQPRSPVQKSYYPEDGTVYFHPTPSRWADMRIQPLVASLVTGGSDVLRDLISRREQGGLGVSCWTVCLHNTRLGLKHPDAVTRNAFGDPNRFNLCPSHPDARAFVKLLCEDLSATYKPDAIELESPTFMEYAHGFHHEKDGVGLTAEDDFLLSLCFCPACLDRAAKAGVDGEKARTTVRRWIADAFERAIPQPRWPDFPDAGLEVFRLYPEVYSYLMWRFEPVTSLLQEIRSHTDQGTKLYLIDLKNGWLNGCDLETAGRACDGAILCAYDMGPSAVTELLLQGRAAVGPDRFLGAGFRLFYPELKAPADLAERAGAASAAGCNGLNFYNYGLVPRARLAWAKLALAC